MRRLLPFGFALAVIAFWAATLNVLTPELFRIHLLQADRLTVSQQTHRLEQLVPAIDQAITRTLEAAAPGIAPTSHREQLEEVHGVRWRSSRRELQVPATTQPEAVAAALRGLRFDPGWQVKIDTISLEPLSVTLQVTAMGYPTHLLTLHPTLTQTVPSDLEPEQRIRIAILIDDVGQDRTALDPLWSLSTPFSVAIIPYTPHALTLAQEAWTRHREILVHLSMEPLPRPDGRVLEPQLGQLTLAMSPAEVKAATKRALRAVPYAAGVNNHQGSAFTRDRTRMTAMLEVVRAESMFFVDSRTIADSVGYAVARELKVPATERQVFLDNDPQPEEILRALGRLRAIAIKRGKALGICHPHPATIQVLEQWLPQAEADGFQLVPVSGLL